MAVYVLSDEPAEGSYFQVVFPCILQARFYQQASNSPTFDCRRHTRVCEGDGVAVQEIRQLPDVGVNMYLKAVVLPVMVNGGFAGLHVIVPVVSGARLQRYIP